MKKKIVPIFLGFLFTIFTLELNPFYFSAFSYQLRYRKKERETKIGVYETNYR